MLHSKLLQKYLASVVCCLVLVMGISTILLAYSFHMRRSPLLVKALGFEESLESPNRGHLLQSSEQNHNIFKGITTNDQFTTSRYILQNELPALTEQSILDKHNGYEKSPYKIQTFTDVDKPEKNFESFGNTDTIYIDDFERVKTNNIFYEDNILKKYNKKNDASVEKSMVETPVGDLRRVPNSKNKKLKQRKNTKNRKRIILPEQKTESVFTKSQDNSVNEKMRESFVITNDVQKTVNKPGLRSNKQIIDDTEDDVSAHGSGSGDYAITDLDELPYYDNFVVQHFSADWIDADRRLDKNSLSGKQALESTDGMHDKERNKLRSRLGEQLTKDLPHSKMLSYSLNSGFNAKKEGNLKSTSKKKKAIKRNRLTHSGSLHDYIQQPFKPEEQSLHKGFEASDISRSSSEAWVETRTRRIIGNVKKSEERSRQLLLCEEAGGGELCRMLFKGHIRE